MPQYLGTDDSFTSVSTLQDFAPTGRQKMSAAVREAWLESYGPVATDLIRGATADDKRKITAAEAESMRLGIGGGARVSLKPKDNEYTAGQWTKILERQRELAAVKDVRERTPWEMGSVLRGGAMFGAGMVDPINLATAFVPWTRSITALNSMRVAAVAGESFAARTGARALLGGADAGISTAVLEPFFYAGRQALGDDYNAIDSLANIAFGTAFGGGLHVIGGAVGDAFRGRFSRTDPTVNTTPMGDAPPLNEPPSVADLAAGRAAPEPVVSREAELLGVESRGAPETRIDGVPDKVQQAVDEQIARVEQAVEPVVARAADAPAPENLVTITKPGKPAPRNDLLAAMKKAGGISTLLAREATGENGMRLNRALPGLVRKEGGFQQYDEAAQFLADDGFLTPGIDPLSYEAAYEAEDLISRALNGERILRWQDQMNADLEAQYRDYEPASTADVMLEVSPETREATLRAAVAQAADGRAVDVEPIIGLDDAMGTHTIEDVAGAADRNFAPESQPLADFEVSRAVDERNAAAPKWEALEAADQALAEADALLADTVKAGDEAYKYSRQKEMDQRDLIVTHNLTAANLLHARKMGGIAVPSLAITKKNTPLTGFGEITLIGDKDLADPKGYAKTKVFGADIYSPRYPNVEYKLTPGSLKKLNEVLAPYATRPLYGDEVNRLDDLIGTKAFKAYADAQIGGQANWGQLKEQAQKLLGSIGADERIFQGFTNSGNRKYTPHTLDNVVKILKKELRGGESFNYGVGSLRAKFTPEFKSIAQIKKEKGRLVSAQDFEPVKKEIDAELVGIAEDLGLSLDQTIEVFEDAPKMGVTRSIERALKDYRSGSEATDEVKARVGEFLTRLRNLPTAYFEAKVLRDVSPAEFKGAAVPDDIAPEALEFLRENVSDVRTYKAGDEADRAKVIQSFSDLMFSRGERSGDALAGELNDAIRTAFGDSTDALLASGRVKIVASVTDIPDGPHPGDVKAATAPDGTVYIVADNVSPAEAKGMLLHEVGVHVGMEAMVGPEVFGSLLAELDAAILAGESWAQKARAAVPADTPAGLVREEQLAYLVQNAPELPIVQRIIAAVRAWAYRTFEAARERMTLTEADFRAMAVAALHAAARGDGRAGMAAFARDVAQTETKAFRDWFGGSKVVDGEGEPLVVYHGTGADFAEFDPSSYARNFTGDYGVGFYFTQDAKKAGQYADGAAGKGGAPNVMPVYLALKNPAIVNAAFGDGDLWRMVPGAKSREELTAGLIAQGYDGVIVDGGRAGVLYVKEAVAFRPEQIKSATGNRGTFDPKNPDIRYSRGETQDPSTAQDELKPADEAVARAKQFAGVLRAAADKLNNDADAAAAMRAAMPDITKQEIDSLLGQLRKEVKGLRGMARTSREMLTAEDRAAVMQPDAMLAADRLANNLQMAAVIERRNLALNQNARLRASSFLNQFRKPGLDFEGFRALLVGSERKRDGARLSVDAEQKNFRGEWLGGMIADLEKNGTWQAFTSGQFDRDVYVALHAIGKGEQPAGVSPEAVKIAEVVNKYQTDARNTRNRFGAWIRDLSGYITRQTHDTFKIRDVGQAEWVRTVMPMLDIPKMQRLGLISEADPARSLADLYGDFAAGRHMKVPAGEDDMAAFGSGRNLAKRESASRALYFKDGDAAFQYNTKFGQGRLAETVLQGLDGAAKSAGLLKVLGTNPEATLDRLFMEYEDSLRGDPERRAKFAAKKGELRNLLATIDGTTQIPGNVQAAQIAAFTRAWMTMAKLGGMLISSITDLSNYAAEMRFGQDKNLLSGVLDGMGSLTRGRAKGEQKQILASLGVFHESILGGAYHRFDNPDLMGGKTAAAMQTFFKFTGINWWTETLRDAYALSHSNYMASNSGKAFDALPDGLRDMLGLYKIDAGKWEILRSAPMQAADGRNYMTPEGVNTLPRQPLEAYIASVGRTVTDSSVQNLRDDLASALRAMTIDRMHHAVIEPGARTRAFMQRGTQPGTVPGELLRYVGQFKSFPVALVQMTLGREVYGRGYDTIGEYLRKGRGDMLGLASFIALSVGMGYAAMSIKDLLRGKNPRPVNDYRTWMAAFVQGGGLGIYGDFLFGQYSRTGGGFTSSLAGPVAGTIDTLMDIKTRIQKGDDVAAASFKAALDNTPFANLFYTRVVLDYLILHRIQESLNPGFLRRMEQRAQRDNGQTYWLPPSEVAR